MRKFNIFGGVIAFAASRPDVVYTIGNDVYHGSYLMTVTREFGSYRINSDPPIGMNRVLTPQEVRYSESSCIITFNEYIKYPDITGIITLTLSKLSKRIAPRFSNALPIIDPDADQNEVIGPDQDTRDIYVDETIGP